MSERTVTQTRKDSNRNITHLCKPGENWSPKKSSDVIYDIECKIHRYYVPKKSGGRTEIHVVNGSNGKHLRTNPDDIERNNLDELPDC